MRRLRVLVEHLVPDGPLQEALGGTLWGEQEWLLHDISTHLRALTAMTHNVHRGASQPPVTLEPLPHPVAAGDDERQLVDEEQRQIEAHLTALMHRGEGS